MTAANDYQRERQFRELNKVADDRKRVTVIRDSVQVEIHMDQVMVGDVITLFEGMEVPADGMVFEANDLTTDESAMTGETGNKENLLDIFTQI